MPVDHTVAVYESQVKDSTLEGTETDKDIRWVQAPCGKSTKQAPIALQKQISHVYFVIIPFVDCIFIPFYTKHPFYIIFLSVSVPSCVEYLT